MSVRVHDGSYVPLAGVSSSIRGALLHVEKSKVLKPLLMLPQFCKIQKLNKIKRHQYYLNEEREYSDLALQPRQ